MTDCPPDLLKDPPEKIAHDLLNQHGLDQSLLIAKSIAYDMIEDAEPEGFGFMKDVVAAIRALRQ